MLEIEKRFRLTSATVASCNEILVVSFFCRINLRTVVACSFKRSNGGATWDKFPQPTDTLLVKSTDVRALLWLRHLFHIGDGRAVQAKGAMGAPFQNFHLTDAASVVRIARRQRFSFIQTRC
jgi:hypothetical protein